MCIGKLSGNCDNACETAGSDSAMKSKSKRPLEVLVEVNNAGKSAGAAAVFIKSPKMSLDATTEESDSPLTAKVLEMTPSKSLSLGRADLAETGDWTSIARRSSPAGLFCELLEVVASLMLCPTARSSKSDAAKLSCGDKPAPDCKVFRRFISFRNAGLNWSRSLGIFRANQSSEYSLWKSRIHAHIARCSASAEGGAPTIPWSTSHLCRSFRMTSKQSF